MLEMSKKESRAHPDGEKDNPHPRQPAPVMRVGQPVIFPPRTTRVRVRGDGSRNTRRGCVCGYGETDKTLYAVDAFFGELAESGC